MAIKFSLRFAMLLLLLHFMAAILVYMAVMALEIRMAMLMLIMLSLIYYLMRDVYLLLPDSWHVISFDQGNVAVVTRNGSNFVGRIANQTTVSQHLVVLCIQREGHRLQDCRVIFPDALGSGLFREICVLLKLG